jgi:NAD(P)-dependent dehydrogenase (short-subunit alcohol dehydrogenase family)
MLLLSFFVLCFTLGGYFLSISLLAREYPVHNQGIVLITGASTGIGFDAALSLAEIGTAAGDRDDRYHYHVYAGVRKDQDIVRIKNLNITNLTPILLDVSQHQSCVQVMNFLTQETDRLQLPFIALVNNAGVSRKLPIEFHDLDDAKRVFNTNYFGALDMIQLSLPLLRKSQGRIVMTSSITGFIGQFLFLFLSFLSFLFFLSYFLFSCSSSNRWDLFFQQTCS